MREIKFRAWDKITKRFVQNDKDFLNRKGCNIGEVALTPKGEVIFYEDTEGGMVKHKYNDIVLLQYTGLKDKKGKGIYTGDIVQHENSNPVEVFIGHLGELQPFAFHNTAQGWEVIGNIYEHPHLLQPNDN